jgi:predicted SprT family Zn-dependent metalloprotease
MWDLITFVKVFPLFLIFLCGVLLFAKWRKQRVFGKTIGKKDVYCKNCEAKLSRFRRPDNAKQFWHGGWTCRKCGKQLDRRGYVLN